LDYPTSAAAAADGALVLRQDLSLLPHLVSVGAEEWERLCKLGKFDPDTLTWIPAHYSSERMKEIVFKEFARRGINAGRPEKSHSNLTSVGNIGSAAIFVEVAGVHRTAGSRWVAHSLGRCPTARRVPVSVVHLAVLRSVPRAVDPDAFVQLAEPPGGFGAEQDEQRSCPAGVPGLVPVAVAAHLVAGGRPSRGRPSGNGQRLGLRMHVRAKCERDVGMA
jgi:hypothetical protein